MDINQKKLSAGYIPLIIFPENWSHLVIPTTSHKNRVRRFNP